MSYEKEQKCLENMWDAIDFSDEEDPFSASESEYEGHESESESSSDENIPVKKRKITISTKSKINEMSKNLKNSHPNVSLGKFTKSVYFYISNIVIFSF